MASMDRERWHSAAGRAWHTCRALPGEILAFLAECARDHRVRLVLLWCIPALACGLAADGAGRWATTVRGALGTGLVGCLSGCLSVCLVGCLAACC